MRTLMAAGERSAGVLTLAKLANVALSMLWGFAVTYVFVRVLPRGEFAAFLLLVAFNNFTISAEFGMTNVIYARLRRWWLGRQAGDTGDFRLEEIGVLFLFLTGLILAASAGVATAILLGWIGTRLPVIFLIFFLASALNIVLLMAKRALAAVDRNLLWESIDFVRRIAGLAALFAVLGGFDLAASVAIQLGLNVAAALIGLALVHRATGMRIAHWVRWHVGGGHVRRGYLGSVGASVALTASEVVAYNAPYFLIAAMTDSHALLLIFDFAFKMIRAVSTAIRATIEGALPALTRAWFEDKGLGFGRGLKRAMLVAMGVAGAAAALLLLAGGRLVDILYRGEIAAGSAEMGLLGLLLLSLSVMCVSVYVQGALGRFRELVRRSLPFLAGSLAVTPLALSIGGGSGAAFLTLYAFLFMGMAIVHLLSLAKLGQAR